MADDIRADVPTEDLIEIRRRLTLAIQAHENALTQLGITGVRGGFQPHRLIRLINEEIGARRLQ